MQSFDECLSNLTVNYCVDQNITVTTGANCHDPYCSCYISTFEAVFESK